MISKDLVVLVVIAGAFVALLGFVVRLFFVVKQINENFGKLGYVVREDAKKYFDDAAGKLVETNRQFKQQYERIVQDSTRESLIDSGVVMEKALADAQSEAGKVILKAQQEARQIVEAGKQHSKEMYMQSLNQSVDALTWTLEQYAGQHVDSHKHEAIINRLLEKYVNENRQ